MAKQPITVETTTTKRYSSMSEALQEVYGFTADVADKVAKNFVYKLGTNGEFTADSGGAKHTFRKA